MSLPATEPLLLIPDVQLAGKLPSGVLSIIDIIIIIIIIIVIISYSRVSSDL